MTGVSISIWSIFKTKKQFPEEKKMDRETEIIERINALIEVNDNQNDMIKVNKDGIQNLIAINTNQFNMIVCLEKEMKLMKVELKTMDGWVKYTIDEVNKLVNSHALKAKSE